MNEKRPLPLGVQEWEDWADRIISGACLPENVTQDTQKGALASMIMHLGPHESHKEDAYFIHGLRKSAASQVAHDRFSWYAAKVKAELKTKEEQELFEANKGKIEAELGIQSNE